MEQDFIDVDTLKRLIDQSKNDLQLIDVRSPSEFFEHHIEGAKLIPIDEILKNPLEVLDLYKTSPSPIYFICRTHGRSATAVQLLKNLGLYKAFYVQGGMCAWIAAGYKTA